MVLAVTGANANMGYWHGNVSDILGYQEDMDVLQPGARSNAGAQFLDYTGGPFLPESQAEEYIQTNTNRSWLRDYAALLPASTAFTLAMNGGGVQKTGNCQTIADVLASNPATNNSCRNLLARSLDHMQTLQNGYNVKVVAQWFHELNGGWYDWGITSGTDADFKALFEWYLGEAKARGLETGWVLSIGPYLNSAVNDYDRYPDTDTNLDVMVLNLYDKVSANRTPAQLLAALQQFQGEAVTRGKSVALGEWGSGGHASIQFLADTYKEVDTWPATGPGSLRYLSRWNAANGGPSNTGGGSQSAYYDFTRAAGIAAFPCRSQFEIDMWLWVAGGKVGTAPYDNPTNYFTQPCISTIKGTEGPLGCRSIVNTAAPEPIIDQIVRPL